MTDDERREYDFRLNNDTKEELVAMVLELKRERAALNEALDIRRRKVHELHNDNIRLRSQNESQRENAVGLARTIETLEGQVEGLKSEAERLKRKDGSCSGGRMVINIYI